jgi:hypothetical protein
MSAQTPLRTFLSKLAQTQRSPRTGDRVRTATSKWKIEDVEYAFTAMKLYGLRLATLMASLLSV